MGFREAINENTRSRLQPEVRRHLSGLLVTYAFHGDVSVDDIRTEIVNKDIDFDLGGFTKNLSTNGSALLSSKTFLYSNAASQSGKYQALTAKECGVAPQEERLLRELWNHSKPLRATLKRYAKEGYKPLKPDELNRLVYDVLSSRNYEEYVSKFVSFKMSFLIKSFGFTKADLITDLKVAAAYALLRTYPAYNDYTHVLRLAKAQTRNTGINLIYKWTTAGRQRLTRDNQSLIVPLHAIEATSGSSDGSFVSDSYLVVGRNGTRTSNDELDTRMSLQKLMECDRFSVKQKRFLKLMMGTHDEEFSQFLGSPNEEVVYHSYERYLNRVCSFLNIPVEQASKFLHKLAVFL